MSYSSNIVAPSVSYSTTPALTTIFKPPPDCFSSFPSTWTACKKGAFPPICYWQLPNTCYPTGGQTYTATLGVNAGLNFGANAPGAIVTEVIEFSPGVLPMGFTTVSQELYAQETVVTGCLRGWSTYFDLYCTTHVGGLYSVGSSNYGNDIVTALMPQLQVAWQSEDLTEFTPASAPILPRSVVKAYESSVSRSISRSVARSKSISLSRSIASAAQKTAGPGPTGNQTNAVGSGQQDRIIGIGIGTGIGAALLGCLTIGCLLRCRRRKA